MRRDFNVRSTKAAGSISAASNQLTLTAAPAVPFAVGDHIIIEVGGEAGAGARATQGVGGIWPGPQITVDSGAYRLSTEFVPSQPIINVNNNIGAMSPHGGMIDDVEMIQNGCVDTANTLMPGIIIGPSQPGVHVVGDRYVAPDQLAAGQGQRALTSQSTNTYVADFEADGRSAYAVSTANPITGRSNICVVGGEIWNTRADTAEIVTGVANRNNTFRQTIAVSQTPSPCY